MAEREFGGPYQAPKGWVVFQLNGKEQSTRPFESLPPVVVQHLTREATEMKREARLTAFTDSLRQVIPIVESPGRLKKIPWPPPGAPAPRA